MIRSTLAILPLLVITFFADAQQTVEGTYLPVRGTAIRQVYDTVASELFVPTEGENQFWDYSDKFVNQTDTFALQTFHPDSAGAGMYRHLFPEATHASYLTMPFENSIGHMLYSYFKIDSAGVTNIGAYSVRPDIDTAVYMPDPELFMPFEVTYGDTVQDSVCTVIYSLITDTTISVGGFPLTLDSLYLKVVEKKKKFMTASAYGTIKTPIGRFENVLLGKEENTSETKAYYKLSASADYANDGLVQSIFPDYTDSYNRYNFVANNTFGSTHLLLLVGDTAETYISMGWFTVPMDIGYIAGTVTDSVGAPVTAGKMMLYREHSNFAKDDVLDTAAIMSDGSYRFDSIPLGQYRVAARADEAVYPNSLTTYTGNEDDWENAEVITTNGDMDNVDITLSYTAGNTGNSTVSGNVLFNSIAVSAINKTAGDPIPGIDVSLEQIPDGGIQYQTETETQLGGEFFFEDIAPGSYVVWVEVPGMPMCSTSTFTLEPGQAASDVDFQADQDQVCPVGEAVISGVTELPNDVKSIFPNPFNEQLIVEFKAESNTKQIKFVDALGNLIAIHHVRQGDTAINYSTSHLPSGMYFVQFFGQHQEITSTVKVLKH